MRVPARGPPCAQSRSMNRRAWRIHPLHEIHGFSWAARHARSLCLGTRYQGEVGPDGGADKSKSTVDDRLGVGSVSGLAVESFSLQRASSAATRSEGMAVTKLHDARLPEHALTLSSWLPVYLDTLDGKATLRRRLVRYVTN